MGRVERCTLPSIQQNEKQVAWILPVSVQHDWALSAGGVAKANGKSGGEAALTSLAVGFVTKLVSSAIRTFLKK